MAACLFAELRQYLITKAQQQPGSVIGPTSGAPAAAHQAVDGQQLLLCWCCSGAVLVLCWCCAGAVLVLYGSASGSHAHTCSDSCLPLPPLLPLPLLLQWV